MHLALPPIDPARRAEDAKLSTIAYDFGERAGR
jgi:hypothetical protein